MPQDDDEGLAEFRLVLRERQLAGERRPPEEHRTRNFPHQRLERPELFVLVERADLSRADERSTALRERTVSVGRGGEVNPSHALLWLRHRADRLLHREYGKEQIRRREFEEAREEER